MLASDPAVGDRRPNVYDAHSENHCIGRRIVDPTTLTALSPLDGRYAAKAAPLRQYLSEYALIRYRVLIEVRWLQHLADEPAIGELHSLPSPLKDVLNGIVDHFSLEDARRVKALEETTNHDVKAVEYFLRDKLHGTSTSGVDANLSAFIHFACTSEDINNVAYALMLRDARARVLGPALKELVSDLRTFARRHADLAMLARTHGQSASPTTLGKEFANAAARVERQTRKLMNVEIYGKFNGAVGNFNTHVAAYPDVDWRDSSCRFLESLGIEYNAYTTQIEPHDWIAEYCQALARCNTVLVDLCRDLWSYISIGYFNSRAVADEIGSSTMPHKVNPIEFENAEGNFGLANALLEFCAGKLPISRMQRDLTDSTVLRNLAVALGHGLIAVESCQRGLDKLEADTDRIAADLTDHWELLAEAVQTVMRRHGVDDAYEQLKTLTRGRRVDEASLRAFIESAPIPEEARRELLALRPTEYLGLAPQLARDI